MEKVEIISRLASSLGRRDEEPNRELASKLVEAEDKQAVAILVECLVHKDKGIRHDSIKVLYEIGGEKPELIEPYHKSFVDLLQSKDNRMQWGGMAALATVATRYTETVYPHLNDILSAAGKGSVITRDGAVKILVCLYQSDKHAEEVFHLIHEQLLVSPTNQLPMYAELVLPHIRSEHKEQLASCLESRLDEIEKESKRKRVVKVLKKL